MKHALLILAVLSVSACGATTASPGSPESMRAASLARLLEQTAAQDPARIVAADGEMAALEYALLARPDVTPQAAAPEPASEPLPAPDLTGARSVLHGVHLTSYRDQAHVAAGWRALQGALPALDGLSARVAPADLGERGVYLRLKAGPFDSRDAAQAWCAQAQAEGYWCQPVDFTGAPVSGPGSGPHGG
ncbi:SPOR domain-containing protein [Hyphomonadaceae bacterium ML37]|nr:SPOR domain-containing protein [Hyphomonadaceae bacterium ML37]